jgi:phosphoglycerate dehydrogenase-like enzyme
MTRIVVHFDRPEPLLELLQSRHPGAALEVCRDYPGLGDVLSAFAPEILFTVRFAGTPGFPRDAILSTGSLAWISVGGSGTDHLVPWDPRRLTVTNAAGVASDMMAQYAIGAIFHFSLGFHLFAAAQRAHRWTGGTVAPVDGRRVLILGLGKTGQDVARRAKAMGLTVIGVRANPRPTPQVDQVFGPDELDSLWPQADYIVVCVPLTDSTRGLVGRRAFGAMKPQAVLIDVSRGGVVAEAALLQALEDGRIKGAALDVFETEPLPSHHPFWGLDNVLITPHCSSVYEGWERRSMEMFCDNLDRWLRREPLENVVDPARGY